MNKINTIIFDFDGTISDSSKLWDSINAEYFSSLNINYSPNCEFSKKMSGMKCDQIAQLINEIKNSKYTEQEIKEGWLRTSKKYFKYARLKPGVKHFIKFLWGKNYQLGIVSTNFKENIITFLKENELLQYFKLIISEQDVVKIKPNPEGFFKAAELLNVRPENCLVFEDSLNGIVSAKEAGMKVIAVFDKQSEHNIDKINTICDKFIYSYEELIHVPDIYYEA